MFVDSCQADSASGLTPGLPLYDPADHDAHGLISCVSLTIKCNFRYRNFNRKTKLTTFV